MNRIYLYSTLQALLAALLFGASAPLAKLLLGEVEPITFAAFLYLGSGISMLGIKLLQRNIQDASNREAQIKKTDLPWLAGAILAGGVAAPITLLIGLQTTPAATASLLLNFECVGTTLIAILFFKESISRMTWWAIGFITLSSIILSINFNTRWSFSIGAMGIIAACVLWGLDNNLTRYISSKDPIIIVTLKGFGAGSFSLVMALLLESPLPAFQVILGAMALGSLSYGLSIVLFIHAMRGLGAARTSALFGTAPLAGMLLSFLLFRQLPGWLFFIALILMIVGTLIIMNEEHNHHHVHKMTIHEHSHRHDDGHHDHDHNEQFDEKHTHIHNHDGVAHSHHHMPDLHHRHIHISKN